MKRLLSIGILVGVLATVGLTSCVSTTTASAPSRFRVIVSEPLATWRGIVLFQHKPTGNCFMSMDVEDSRGGISVIAVPKEMCVNE